MIPHPREIGMEGISYGSAICVHSLDGKTIGSPLFDRLMSLKLESEVR